MAKAYPNRTDLQNPGDKVAKQAFKGQTYGEATKQMQAQSAVPIASSPTDQTPPPPQPGQIGGLTSPTERPNEPISSGMDFGAGPNADIFGQIRPEPGSNADLAERVRAIAAIYPNPALLQLAMDLEA